MFINTVMFDLDGTLIDSAVDIQNCLKEAYDRVLAIDLKFDVRPYLGPTITNMIKAITPNIADDKVIEIEKLFRQLYDNCGFQQSIPYKSAIDILEFFYQTGIKIYIVTNKPKIPSRSIISKYITWDLEIVSPDYCTATGILSKKEMIALILNKYDIQAEEALFVGDTAGDILAAHSNGVRAVGVSFGYGDKKALYESQPDFITDELLKLKPIVKLLEG